MREICVAESREAAMRLARPSLEQKYPGVRGLGPAAGAPERRRHDAGVRRAAARSIHHGVAEACADEVQRCVDETGRKHDDLRVTWPGMPQEGISSSLRLLAEGSGRASRREGHESGQDLGMNRTER